jgi:hypothetical protein
MLPPRYFDRFYEWLIRPIQNDADIQRVHAIAADNFGDDTFALDHINGWHERYPEGRRLLCDQGRIIGYVSIWPIDADQADSFAKGLILEENLTPLPIQQVLAEGAQHWFIGAVVIDRPFRKPRSDNPIGMMLAMALNSWAESGQLRYPLSVLTLAYSDEGEAMLKRFGFEKTRDRSQMPDEQPLYRRDATDKNDLFRAFAQRGIPCLFEDAGG